MGPQSLNAQQRRVYLRTSHELENDLSPERLADPQRRRASRGESGADIKSRSARRTEGTARQMLYFHVQGVNHRKSTGPEARDGSWSTNKSKLSVNVKGKMPNSEPPFTKQGKKWGRCCMSFVTM